MAQTNHLVPTVSLLNFFRKFWSIIDQDVVGPMFVPFSLEVRFLEDVIPLLLP